MKGENQWIIVDWDRIEYDKIDKWNNQGNQRKRKKWK